MQSTMCIHRYLPVMTPARWRRVDDFSFWAFCGLIYIIFVFGVQIASPHLMDPKFESPPLLGKDWAGRDGTAFEDKGPAMERLKIWTGPSPNQMDTQISALQIHFLGERVPRPKRCTSSSHGEQLTTIDFRPGEFVSGICGVHADQMISFLNITTTEGRSFQVGTLASAQSDSVICLPLQGRAVGFHGGCCKSTKTITRLGVISEAEHPKKIHLPLAESHLVWFDPNVVPEFSWRQFPFPFSSVQHTLRPAARSSWLPFFRYGFAWPGGPDVHGEGPCHSIRKTMCPHGLIGSMPDRGPLNWINEHAWLRASDWDDEKMGRIFADHRSFGSMLLGWVAEDEKFLDVYRASENAELRQIDLYANNNGIPKGLGLSSVLKNQTGTTIQEEPSTQPTSTMMDSFPSKTVLRGYAAERNFSLFLQPDEHIVEVCGRVVSSEGLFRNFITQLNITSNLGRSIATGDVGGGYPFCFGGQGRSIIGFHGHFKYPERDRRNQLIGGGLTNLGVIFDSGIHDSVVPMWFLIAPFEYLQWVADWYFSGSASRDIPAQWQRIASIPSWFRAKIGDAINAGVGWFSWICDIFERMAQPRYGPSKIRPRYDKADASRTPADDPRSPRTTTTTTSSSSEPEEEERLWVDLDVLFRSSPSVNETSWNTLLRAKTSIRKLLAERRELLAERRAAEAASRTGFFDVAVCLFVGIAVLVVLGDPKKLPRALAFLDGGGSASGSVGGSAASADPRAPIRPGGVGEVVQKLENDLEQYRGRDLCLVCLANRREFLRSSNTENVCVDGNDFM